MGMSTHRNGGHYEGDNVNDPYVESVKRYHSQYLLIYNGGKRGS